AVDRRAGGLRDGGHGADVVEMRVGEQDRLELDAEVLDGVQQPIGLLAGVDHEGAGRVLRADEERVLLDRADGEHADVEAHRSLPSARWRWRRRYIHRSV